MAAKRQRVELGGGTGDVKPQYFTMKSGAMLANQYDVVSFALPVPRFGTMKTKATVFEILSLDWFLAIDAQLDGTHVTWGFLTTSTARLGNEPALLLALQQDLAEPRTLGPAVQVNISWLPLTRSRW